MVGGVHGDECQLSHPVSRSNTPHERYHLYVPVGKGVAYVNLIVESL